MYRTSNKQSINSSSVTQTRNDFSPQQTALFNALMSTIHQSNRPNKIKRENKTLKEILEPNQPTKYRDPNFRGDVYRDVIDNFQPSKPKFGFHNKVVGNNADEYKQPLLNVNPADSNGPDFWFTTNKKGDKIQNIPQRSYGKLYNY